MAKNQKGLASPLVATSLGAQISRTGSTIRVSSAGVEQSAIDLSRPRVIEFEYLQHMDLLLDAGLQVWDSPHPRVLHAGAGACALPLAWEATYPQLSQVAVEIDPELAEEVSRAAGLKRKPRLKLRVGDAAEVLTGSQSRYNVIVRDAFIGPHTPHHLRTSSWTRLVSSRLLDEGVYLANVGRDSSNVGKEDVATILDAFPASTIITDPKVWRGDRSGNLVVAGWVGDLPDFEEIERQIRRLPLPARLYRSDEVQLWLGGARPLGG